MGSGSRGGPGGTARGGNRGGRGGRGGQGREVMPIEVTFLAQKVWPRWAKENTWIDLVNYMKLNNLLPAVVFVF